MSATIEGKISFVCPNCQAHLQVPGRLAGVTGPCPKCSATIVAPAEPAEPKPPVEAEAPAREVHHEASGGRKKGFASLRRRTKRVDSLPVKSLKSISDKSPGPVAEVASEEALDLSAQTPFQDPEPVVEEPVSREVEETPDLDIPSEDSLGGLDWLAPARQSDETEPQDELAEPLPGATDTESEPGSEPEADPGAATRAPIDLTRDPVEAEADPAQEPPSEAIEDGGKTRQWAWESEGEAVGEAMPLAGDESDDSVEALEEESSEIEEAQASPAATETEDDWLLAGPDAVPVMEATGLGGAMETEDSVPPPFDLESELDEVMAKEKGEDEKETSESSDSAPFPKWNSLGGDTILGQVLASEKKKEPTDPAPAPESREEPGEVPALEQDPWQPPAATDEKAEQAPELGEETEVPPPLNDESESGEPDNPVAEVEVEVPIPAPESETAPPLDDPAPELAEEESAWTPPGAPMAASESEEVPVDEGFAATPWLAPGAMQRAAEVAEAGSESSELPPPIEGTDEIVTEDAEAPPAPEEAPVPAGLPRFLGGTESATMEEAAPPPIDEAALAPEGDSDSGLPAGLPPVPTTDASLDSPILGLEEFGEGEPPRPGEPAAAPAQRISLPQIEDAIEGGARAEVSEVPIEEMSAPELPEGDLESSPGEGNEPGSEADLAEPENPVAAEEAESPDLDDLVVPESVEEPAEKGALDLSDLDLSFSPKAATDEPDLGTLEVSDSEETAEGAEVEADGDDKADAIAASLAGKLGGDAFSSETVEPEIVGDSESRESSPGSGYSDSLAEGLAQFAPLGRKTESSDGEDAPGFSLSADDDEPSLGSRLEAKLAALDPPEGEAEEVASNESVSPPVSGERDEVDLSGEAPAEEFEGSPEDEGMAKVLGLMPRQGEGEEAEGDADEMSAESGGKPEAKPGDSEQPSIDELLKSGKKDLSAEGPDLDWKGRFIGGESEAGGKKKLLVIGGIAAVAVASLFGIGSMAGWFGEGESPPDGGGGTSAGVPGNEGGGEANPEGGESVTVQVGGPGGSGGPSTLVIADPGTNKPPFTLPRDDDNPGGASGEGTTPPAPEPSPGSTPFDAGSEVSTTDGSGTPDGEGTPGAPPMESLIDPVTPESAVGATDPDAPSTIGNGNIAWEDTPGTGVKPDVPESPDAGASAAGTEVGDSETVILPQVGPVGPGNGTTPGTEGTTPGGSGGYTEIGSAGPGDTPPAGAETSVGNPDEALDRQEEKAMSVAPIDDTPESAQAAVTEAPESPVDPDDPLAASKYALDQFLAQPTWEKRLAYIYEAEALKPKIAAYYQQAPDAPITQSVTKLFDMDEEPADGSDPFYAFYLFLEGLETEFPVIVRRTEEGYKVDWELYVECKDRLFLKFRDSDEMGPKNFRLVMQRHSYWGPDREDFTTSGEFNCYKIEAPYPESAAFVFVGKDSALAEEIEKISTWGLPPVDVVLTLERKKFPHGVNHFVITELAKPSWVAP